MGNIGLLNDGECAQFACEMEQYRRGPSAEMLHELI